MKVQSQYMCIPCIETCVEKLFIVLNILRILEDDIIFYLTIIYYNIVIHSMILKRNSIIDHFHKHYESSLHSNVWMRIV